MVNEDMVSGDRVAVVTGAGGGIGASIAVALAAAGYRVVVNDRNGDNAIHVCGRLNENRTRPIALPHAGDITDPAAIADLSRLVEARWGRVDVLVNNAGIGEAPRPFEDMTADRVRKLLDVLLLGTMMCTHQIGTDFMIGARYGRIINVTSVVGMVGDPRLHAYAAAKAAQAMFTKTLAADWARHGITVNAVAPGYTRTDTVAQLVREGRLDDVALRRRTPTAALSSGDDIARVVTFLAEPDNGQLTGVEIPVDGGWTAYGAAGPAAHVG
ncbi:SDR family NAD(P)-dependent oxidoreductase [Gordonia sp. TBRC 11910]|uniref:3-oxoacyl-[acyl-carrier-protein] reductase MabA n=1 Tax=Gordonia asplenii TaxID=2725283 RepID=A0A848KVN2_9ACTN|nr:SDR family NAD(P)-dependent oxidoreductase [Gordonia asplenii]NMO02322.1 SDR family NAD(P)-dependent oxidoreductase [Gordonia asplenii]